jgi:hypothetical protein
MPPHKKGSVGQYVERLGDVWTENLYRDHQKSQGIVYKRLNKTEKCIDAAFWQYDLLPYEIKASEILEIWQYAQYCYQWVYTRW